VSVSADPTKEFSTMSLPENGQICKTPRERLPNRRNSETFSFEHAGATFTMTAGRHADGRLGEIFIGAAHAASALDAIMSDAAIAISFGLQHGAALDDIRCAMKRNGQGVPSSPIGQALDLLSTGRDT
jgi:hypothetical protein